MEESAMDMKDKTTDTPVTKLNDNSHSHQLSVDNNGLGKLSVEGNGKGMAAGRTSVHSHNEQTFEEKLNAKGKSKKALRSTLQRKTNQFIKELNAQQAEDDGEENSKIVQERMLKKQLLERSKERRTRKERKKQAKANKLQKTLTAKHKNETMTRT
jgi:hypothetical protein